MISCRATPATLLLLAVWVASPPLLADHHEELSPRTIETKELLEYPPLFARQAKALDPKAIARECWEGYLKTQAEPWGMMPGGEPTLRFHFDNRALPWPRLQHHAVDGFDNNSRNTGAHALLHHMFGDEKKNDPTERGHFGYLMSITDPTSGFPYSADRMPRHCALGHGELAQNLILYYQQTGREEIRQWIEKMIATLRHFAVVEHKEGIGDVAAYCQGGIGGQGGFDVGTEPVRDTSNTHIGGWQHLYIGWALGAFARWYEVTGDPDVLEFGVALANRILNSQDGGNDGSFHADGSFGGNDPIASGSWHMHGHTHCLPAMVHMGRVLLGADRRLKGLELIDRTAKCMDWLYDPARNPDAGSLTGWLCEWLIVATGWDRKNDCEGCALGDVVQTACRLGAASRLDSTLVSLSRFYDRAEQIFRGQGMEAMFRVKPSYKAAVRKCLVLRVAKDLKDASAEAREAEVEKRFDVAMKTAERMTGHQLGACGFPDWANFMTSDLDADLPSIHMQGCCSDSTIRAAHAIWNETVTGNADQTRVNLAFHRDHELVKVVSCLPHRGEVNVFVKSARHVLVRVPQWAPRDRVKVFVDKKPAPLAWNGDYVVFPGTHSGQQLTVVYPLRISEVRERVMQSDYVQRWRGNTIVDIEPRGKWIPMFERPQLDTENVPQ